MAVVAAPQRLAGVERRVLADGDEHVLQARPRGRVRVDVPGRDAREPQAPRQRREPAVERAVPAQEGPLQLDAQPLAAERLEQPADRRLVAHAVGGAAGQADQAPRMREDVVDPHPRRMRDPRVAPRRHAALGQLALGPVDPRVRVRARQQPAEVAPPARVAHQQREMTAVVERDLRAVQGPQAHRLGRLGELHRAADRVVVGQRQRAAPALEGRGHQLVGQGRAVEEREGRVAVELDVGHGRTHVRIRSGWIGPERSAGPAVVAAPPRAVRPARGRRQQPQRPVRGLVGAPHLQPRRQVRGRAVGARLERVGPRLGGAAPAQQPGQRARGAPQPADVGPRVPDLLDERLGGAAGARIRKGEVRLGAPQAPAGGRDRQTAGDLRDRVGQVGRPVQRPVAATTSSRGRPSASSTTP